MQTYARARVSPLTVLQKLDLKVFPSTRHKKSPKCFFLIILIGELTIDFIVSDG